MMTHDKSDSTHHTPQTTQTAKEASEGPKLLKVSVGDSACIRTPQDAIQTLRSLSREARAIQEGLSRLTKSDSVGRPTARRHLRFSQRALDHAAAIFELLASLLESD